MIMKKTIIYFAALLVAFSCARPELEQQGTVKGNGTGTGISLAIKSALVSPKTKATPPDGETTLNENKIYTLDYFLYKQDPSAEGNTSSVTPFMKGRFSYDGIEPITEELALANAKVISLEGEYTEAAPCYAYVIANLPADHFSKNSDGDIVYKATSTDNGTVIQPTWEGLEAIKLVTDYLNSLENGKFKAQDSFVMTGFNSVQVTGTGTDLIKVDLKRVVSKVSLKINVIKMIEQYVTNNVTQTEDYKGTWFPNIDEIQIYMSYANRAGLSSGTHVGRTYSQSQTDFFTYNRYAYIAEVDPEGTYKGQSLAKYQNEDASADYYTDNDSLVGTIVTDGEGNPIFIDGTEYPAYEVSGTPFYSYPMSWKTSDSHAPFIKLIIPWVQYDIKNTAFRNLEPDDPKYTALINAITSDNGFASANLEVTADGATTVIERLTTAAALQSRKGDEFYYKISIPAQDGNSTTDCALKRNNWYMINLDVAVLGSESDDASIQIHGSTMGIYVVDWSRPQDPLGGDLDGGRYLSVAQKEFTMNAIDELSIPVISSHNLKATIVSVRKRINSIGNGEWETLTSDEQTSRGIEVSTTGSSSVKLKNELHNEIVNAGTSNESWDLDCYPFEFVIRIDQVNSSGNVETESLTETITVTQYPPIYVDAKEGGNVMIDGFYGNVDGHFHTNATNNYYGNSSTTNYRSTAATPYAPVTQHANEQYNMTVISISSLGNNTQYTIQGNYGGTWDYLIADPRQPSGYLTGDLAAHFQGTYTQSNSNARLIAWSQEELNAVKLTNTTVPNFIAPRFMISSKWGGMGNWTDPPTGNNSDARRLEIVQKRCATYQEKGYPAGRWRLPTDAEINFVASLQRYDFIDELFTSGGRSISATGGVFTVTNPITYTRTNGNSCRCVYDLWYWGEEPVDGAESTYTVAP